MIPTSLRCPRIALSNCVRCPTRSSRALCRISIAWFSIDRIGTKRIDGRVTASQMAAASAASFLPRLTYAFT